MGVKVIDNCLHPPLYSDLQEITNGLGWSFQPYTSYEGASDAPSLAVTYSADPQDKNAKSIADTKTGLLVSNIVKTVLLNAGEQVNGIGRLRWGLLLKSDKGVNKPHIDSHYQHKTGLIYLNDSDGDTILYNEKLDFNKTTPENMSELFKTKVTEFKRIAHKGNRLVLFEGERLHSSTNPKEAEYRLTLNFNYV